MQGLAKVGGDPVDLVNTEAADDVPIGKACAIDCEGIAGGFGISTRRKTKPRSFTHYIVTSCSVHAAGLALHFRLANT